MPSHAIPLILDSVGRSLLLHLEVLEEMAQLSLPTASEHGCTEEALGEKKRSDTERVAGGLCHRAHEHGSSQAPAINARM